MDESLFVLAPHGTPEMFRVSNYDHLGRLAGRRHFKGPETLGQAKIIVEGDWSDDNPLNLWSSAGVPQGRYPPAQARRPRLEFPP